MQRIKSFSIIEILVVLSLMALVMGITAAHFFDFRPATALKINARKISEILTQARTLAITHKLEHSVYFDSVNNKCELKQGNIVLRVYPLENGVIFDEIKIKDEPLITFKHTGGAKNGGSIYLKNSQDKYNTITIINVTGRVKIFNYDRRL